MPYRCDLCDNVLVADETYYVSDLFGTYSGHVCEKCKEKYELKGKIEKPAVSLDKISE